MEKKCLDASTQASLLILLPSIASTAASRVPNCRGMPRLPYFHLSLPIISPSLPLEVDPLNTARGLR